ncbi:MAG: hypothetical protein ABIA76_03320 [Candidatus Diapherotrites archaeon]
MSRIPSAQHFRELIKGKKNKEELITTYLRETGLNAFEASRETIKIMQSINS